MYLELFNKVGDFVARLIPRFRHAWNLAQVLPVFITVTEVHLRHDYLLSYFSIRLSKVSTPLRFALLKSSSFAFCFKTACSSSAKVSSFSVISRRSSWNVDLANACLDGKT